MLACLSWVSRVGVLVMIDKFDQLRTHGKQHIDTIKMIAYRAGWRTWLACFKLAVVYYLKVANCGQSGGKSSIDIHPAHSYFCTRTLFIH